MNEEKRRQKLDFLIRVAYIVTVMLLIFVVCKFGVSLLLPFVIAYAITLFLKPAVQVLNRDMKLPRPLAVLLMMLLFYGIAGLLLALLSLRLVSAGQDLLLRIPLFYTQQIAPGIRDSFAWIEALMGRIDPAWVARVEDLVSRLISALGSLVTGASSSLLNVVAKGASAVPGLFINFLFTVIATFYFSMDYRRIADFVLAQFSEHTQIVIRDAQRGLGKTIWSYIRSYGVILLVTFTELWIGLSILKIPEAPLVSTLIAVFDILPVVGCGTVMIPWLIVSLIQGLYSRAIGLGILWTIITVIRNMIEPRVVGERVGLHPLVTLIAMFLGGKIFGGIGIWFVPISLAILNDMHRRGVIRLYKEGEKEK